MPCTIGSQRDMGPHRHWACLTPIRGLSSYLVVAYYPGSIGRVLSGDGGELLAVCWSQSTFRLEADARHIG